MTTTVEPSRCLVPVGSEEHGSSITRADGVNMYLERSVLHCYDAVASAELWRHDTARPVHAHEFMEIVVVRSGSAVHRMRSGSQPVAAGSVLIVRPGQWHAYDEPCQLEIWNLYIPYKTLASELAALRNHPVLAAFAAARITTAGVPATDARQLAADGDARGSSPPGKQPIDLAALEPYMFQLAQPFRGSGRSLSRLGQLLVVLDALAPAFTFLEPGEVVPTTHPVVIAATELLDAAPEYPWTLAELAERVHVSASYLCRLFNRRVGISPLLYLARHRLELTARLLLESELSVGQICSKTGWSDPNYMARRFRAFFGTSPSQYRIAFQRPHG
ncbi:MAG: AraC family transcriptional regulator [Acidimicrobiales bacterium]